MNSMEVVVLCMTLAIGDTMDSMKIKGKEKEKWLKVILQNYKKRLKEVEREET